MDKYLFDDIIDYPNPESQAKYESLVGLDELKSRLVKESEILLNPNLLSQWSQEKYGKVIPLVRLFEHRHSLFIIAGDIGTGKTTLAESFGDFLARKNNTSITMFSLSLGTRGSGVVGEMTKFMASAFEEVKHHTEQLRKMDGTYSTTTILLIDEADALAQSRDMEMMHHEDRAGVDALIQGIDSISKSKIPLIIVMCTNRLSSIDPAVRRRAAAIFELGRPNEIQRQQLLKNHLEGTNISEDDLKALAQMTGSNENRSYGYTYSDLVQSVLPALVLETFPDQQITKDKIVELLNKIPPTPPLNET